MTDDYQAALDRLVKVWSKKDKDDWEAAYAAAAAFEGKKGRHGIFADIQEKLPGISRSTVDNYRRAGALRKRLENEFSGSVDFFAKLRVSHFYRLAKCEDDEIILDLLQQAATEGLSPEQVSAKADGLTVDEEEKLFRDVERLHKAGVSIWNSPINDFPVETRRKIWDATLLAEEWLKEKLKKREAVSHSSPLIH